MSLFDRCCPKKPKKSLDYIIKWEEDADKTIKYLSDSIEEIKKMDLKKVFDDYARDEYDWSQVPEFDAKADKVENAVQGHFALLDASGNLVDSGAGIDAVIEEGNTSLVPSCTIYQALQGKANKATNAVSGHIASLDENGNLQDSGLAAGDVITNIEVEDLSELDNITSPGVYHVVVYNESGITETREAKILFVRGSLSRGVYRLTQYLFDRYRIMSRTKAGTSPEWNEWEETNIGNILAEPDDTPTEDSKKLVTSGGVKAALDGKMSSAYSLLIAKDGSSYPIWGQKDADELNNFIASHKEYEEVICKIVLNDYSSLSTIGYAVGLATWRYKTDSHAEIVVRINVGAKVFIVSGQVSQDDERHVDNWATNWERTDYSSLF